MNDNKLYFKDFKDIGLKFLHKVPIDNIQEHYAMLHDITNDKYFSISIKNIADTGEVIEFVYNGETLQPNKDSFYSKVNDIKRIVAEEEKQQKETEEKEKENLISSVSNFLTSDAKEKWSNYVNNYYSNSEGIKKIKVVANLLGMVKGNSSKEEIGSKLREYFPDADQKTVTEVLTIVNVFSSDVLRDLNDPKKHSQSNGESETEQLTEIPDLVDDNIIETGEKEFSDSDKTLRVNAALTTYRYISEHQDRLLEGDKTEFVLDTLSAVHDNWVENNSTENEFRKRLINNETYLYTPLELAGMNTVRKYYSIIKPIFNMINVDVTDSLEDAYYNRAEKYLNDKNIKGIDDLGNLIKQGSNYYPALMNKSNSLDGMFIEGDFNISDAINQRLLFSTVKVVDNWRNNDPKLFRIFNVKRGITEENSSSGFGGLK